MINIILDPQIFIEQKFGGISRYFTEIYSELRKNPEVKINCPLLYTENLHFKESALYADSFQKKYSLLIKSGFILRPFLPRKLKKRNKKTLIAVLEKKKFDLYLPTYYDTMFLNYIPDKPFVLTVYDMIHEIFPQLYLDDPNTAINKKMLLEKATKIIAISNSTKKDILEIYPHIDPNKIEVIYLSYSIIVDDSIKVTLPEKYVLFVGNRTLYKNFIFFLNAISPILRAQSELFLVCAGGNAFNEEELQLIHSLDLQDQITQQNFEDTELFRYYENAQCFVFPSAYEGFGIPVLESMSCGCPVILANHSSFPEVAGDAGIYFELNNESDLKNKLYDVLNNSDLRKYYKTKGLEQVEKFSWKETAEKCLSVYKKAI
jgi:glycosyltransferase involved in cell wall biosynthesis